MADEELEVTENEVPAESGSEGIYVFSEEGAVLDYQETVIVEDRGFYTTPFTDYTVTEGLLLLVFVILLIDFFLNLVRRWF